MASTKLQFTPQKFSSGIADSALLAQGLLTRPDTAKFIYMAIKKENYMRHILSYLADGYTYIDNSEHKWFVQKELTKPQNISSAVKPATNTGINGQPFVVPFLTNYFEVGDVLGFPSGLQARVMNDPVATGTEFFYTLQLVESSPTAFLPASDIAIGTPIAYLYTAFEEYSDGGSTKRSFPMGFSQRTTISRASNLMTGSAATDGLYLELSLPYIDKNTNSMKQFDKKYFTTAAERQTILLFNQDQEYKDWHAHSNIKPDGTTSIAGKNGRQINVGAGIIDQIAPGNTFNYDPLNITERQFMDFLQNIQLASTEHTNTHYFCFCGSGLYATFQRALRDFLQGRIIDSTFFVGNDTEAKKNIRDSLKFGAEFTTYRGLLGSKITFVPLSMFDDVSKFPALYPGTGLPKMSYTGVFIPMLSNDGEVLVELLAKRDREYKMWYTAGSTTPISAKDMGSAIRSNRLDGCSCEILSETAIKVKDPLVCGLMRAM